MRHHRFSGVYTDERGLYTVSSFPGERVYGERLVRSGKKEYRSWNPRRSKLAAYLQKGGNIFPFETASRVLYLGAASGTTASHISDVVVKGQIICVEFSTRSFRDLVDMARDRPPIVPILADARNPEGYVSIVGQADIIYQDVSQRDQLDIFIKNANRMLALDGTGILMLKARSVDSSVDPKKLYRRTVELLEEQDYRTMDIVELTPFQKDHAAIVVSRSRKRSTRHPT